jgi:hypothetical protein
MNFGNMNFDPSSMNFSQMMDTITQFVIGAMLEEVKETLVAEVAALFPDQNVDQEYVDRLACAVYTLMIGVPYLMVQIVGGPIELAHMMLKFNRSDNLSLAALTEKIRHGFADVSPIMSQAITEEIMLLTSQLCLNDWLKHDSFPDEATLKSNMHFYFQAVLERNADIDKMAVKLEGQQRVLAMSPEEQAELPPDILQRILAWKPEDEE